MRQTRVRCGVGHVLRQAPVSRREVPAAGLHRVHEVVHAVDTVHRAGERRGIGQVRLDDVDVRAGVELAGVADEAAQPALAPQFAEEFTTDEARSAGDQVQRGVHPLTTGSLEHEVSGRERPGAQTRGAYSVVARTQRSAAGSWRARPRSANAGRQPRIGHQPQRR